MNEKEMSKGFCCPVCGGKNYDAVYDNNEGLGPGFHSCIKYYICSGCTVQFRDPEKFTGAKKS